MSIFNELLSKISDISNEYTKKFNEDLEEAIQCLDKFEEEILNSKKTRDKLQKKNATTTLQSIHEDDDDSTQGHKDSKDESNATEKTQRGSKKRSKGEVDDMFSPEQDKRQKRSASVKAQSVISKQVNVNLNQKLRRDDENAKTKGRKAKDDNKENTEPSLIQIKQEKISLPPEPELMDMESLNIEIKQEVNKDEVAMPPPMAPVPKPRKGLPKEKSADNTEEEGGRGRRTTRTRKQTDTADQPARASSRSTRASSRASSRTGKGPDAEEPAPAETRPKRTRTKRAVAESAATVNNDKESQPSESATASPAEKPRPKRTRKGQKATDKPAEKPVEPEAEPEPIISPKMEKLSEPSASMSPVLPAKKTNKKENGKIDASSANVEIVSDTLDATKITSQNLNSTVTISNNLDATMVLPNGVYNHAPVTPKSVQMNETVVLETNRETMVIEQQQQPQKAAMDATVVIEKDAKAPNLTEDNSILTDDDSAHEETPPKQPPKPQPLSAVKEKVQQFEEMATRQTRTKTRAMAKKDECTENQTPPDKISKAILSAEQLSLMNNMIFSSKQHISSSTSKLNAYSKPMKSNVTASASKLSVNRTKDSVEEQRREKEDARRKKEALLEAKREMQKKKREEKMAAAAAARSAAERERRAALEAAARGRLEKMAHADAGRQERLKEVEKKKIELARKVAETEERRRADEAARAQRAAELRRAEESRQRQLHEAEALKKEAALMDKEIERRQREFMEKQKLKQKMENSKMLTPLKTPGTPNGLPPSVEPVYMADGFEYLNSDEEQEPVERPIPAWSTSKVWRARLAIQSRVTTDVVDRLFSVRAHTPDLREIFPGIERARLKRTSSAVWRTPPQRLPALAE